ncbi:hypothetical protein GLI01_28690 [Gluconacetobacter liquefaciens]|uniref:DUF4194 domain-containing protein n=1 Tax=Gluconacetobacter liquefaciens TaxID=89584 RepID=A0A370FUV3_GLULI|nr:DUF4194 domain-containing protein [Gluconacetobacter liquefaciens]MBB2187911.1 DUF4194 domain-containing protein [Gluconacetobacter liquefaciens]RDI34205.1 uncharacterized protein DUF4194 [Gluconacetobacter liquefaciens]GBR11049.1 hypothetical protein AA0522_2450 [Gluconacetobacter liquefaciens NRIC 0522]GEB38834.1 hypothetical protein GLI01_28690 [Gluconacetobacter liquefaciens]
MSQTVDAPDDGQAPAQSPASLSTLAIALLKGVIYREDDEGQWGHLLHLQNQMRDYVSVLGLVLMIDPAEGYAYLRSIPEAEEDEGAARMPRLVARRPLSFHVSLLLALLRQQLVRFDAVGGETRLILSRNDIASMLQTFLPESSNEVRQLGQIETYIRRVTELGFLRPMAPDSADAASTAPRYEVRRILKAYIDADWLATLDERLEAYLAHARSLEQTDEPLAAAPATSEQAAEPDAQLFPDYADAGLIDRE